MRNAKLRVGKMKAEVRVRDERVGKMEAVLGKMEAEVREREAEVRCACVCVDGPTDPRSRPLPHLAHFAYPFMYIYLPSLYRPADDPQRD